MSIITYIGDKIKYQNGFGAWFLSVYECDFDIKSERVIGARAQTGRLPEWSVACLTGAPAHFLAVIGILQ